MPLSYLDPKHRASTEEVSADSTQEPNCVEANISASGSGVVIRVEREFAVELIAETKVWVATLPGGSDDLDKDFEYGDDGEYEDLDPDLLDDEL